MRLPEAWTSFTCGQNHLLHPSSKCQVARKKCEHPHSSVFMQYLSTLILPSHPPTSRVALCFADAGPSASRIRPLSIEIVRGRPCRPTAYQALLFEVIQMSASPASHVSHESSTRAVRQSTSILAASRSATSARHSIQKHTKTRTGCRTCKKRKIKVHLSFYLQFKICPRHWRLYDRPAYSLAVR